MAEAETSEGAGRAVPGGALSKAMSALEESMGTEAMAEVTRSADRLVESARSGGFTVTKEGADPIIEVLIDFIGRVRELRSEMRVFDQDPKLGNHDYGLLAASFMKKAANDEQSARFALEKLEKILEKSLEALRIASNQYQEQEESALGSIKRMGAQG